MIQLERTDFSLCFKLWQQVDLENKNKPVAKYCSMIFYEFCVK